MTLEEANKLSVVATLDGQTYVMTYDEETGNFVASAAAPQHSSYPELGHKFQITVTAGGAEFICQAMSFEDPVINQKLQLRVRETTAPTITPIYPVDGEDILTATPTISWSLADSDAGLDLSTVAASLNAVPVQNIEIQNGMCSFSPSRLSAGQSVLEYSVADNDGNVATEQITFNVDTPAPKLIVFEPQDDLITNKVVVHVIGVAHAAPGMYPPFSVSISVNNVDQGPVSVGSDGYFDKLIRLQHGENAILITAKDSIGAASHTLLHATLDQIKPVFISVEMELNEDMKTCTLLVNVVDE